MRLGFQDGSPQIAAAFTDTHDYFFIQLLAIVSALLPADIGLVYFNRAREFGRIRFYHGFADAVREIPCRPILDS